MRKRVTTTIEDKLLKQLDMKLVQSDFFKDRSTYFEFLIKFLPYIPDDTKPGADIEWLIRAMYESLGIEQQPAGSKQADSKDLTETDRRLIGMAKNFSLKTKTEGVEK